MNDVRVSEIVIKNFRAIKNSSITLGEKNVLLGKNNIGKTSLIDAFSAFGNKIKITDVNIELLKKIMENKNSPENLGSDDCVSFQIEYMWNKLNVDYWSLLSSISDSGKTVVLVKYLIPEENYERLKEVDKVDDLLELFVRKSWIGSDDDLKKENLTLLPSHTNLSKYLPLPKFNIENLKSGELFLCPIMAFRYVDSGKDSNDEATANQFSTKISNMISNNTDATTALEKIKGIVRDDVSPAMNSFQDDLKSFAYPKDPKNPLEAILTIDDWVKNPKVRIAQTFEKLDGFELPLNAQGLGYQNIYNIIARISAIFSKMKNLDIHNPVFFAIEEPEAFTHPQLQHIFIEQICSFIDKSAKEQGIPYQLLIISHSSEIAMSALDLSFQLIIGRREKQITHFINWDSIGGSSNIARDKLKKLILNYNAEMLFADKLIAYEGNSERLILNAIIRKSKNELLSEKIAFIPVGTSFHGIQDAIADLYYDKVLLITDLDFKFSEKTGEIKESDGNIETTNSNLKYLFDDPKSQGKINLLDWFKDDPSYISNKLHLTKNYSKNSEDSYKNFMVVTQGYSGEYAFWPRTLESTLVTASKENVTLYEKKGLLRKNIDEILSSNPKLINDVEHRLLSSTIKKADFALNSLDLIPDDSFTVPDYLLAGLDWLEEND